MGFERWRRSESAVNVIFGPMLLAARQLNDLSSGKEQDKGPALCCDAEAFHDVIGTLMEDMGFLQSRGRPSGEETE